MLTQYLIVTDRRTDRQTDRHCNSIYHAVHSVALIKTLIVAK